MLEEDDEDEEDEEDDEDDDEDELVVVALSNEDVPTVELLLCEVVVFDEVELLVLPLIIIDV